MATYPTAKVTTTELPDKSSGQTIEAAHMNAVQAEIIAIEDTLGLGDSASVAALTRGKNSGTGSTETYDDLVARLTNIDTGIDNARTHTTTTTGIHGVGAGAIVGTTLTQTLTNKTLSSPAFSGQVSTDIELGAGRGIIFEGTTADSSETTLVAGEPTADRTITLPDASTTLVGTDTTQTLTNKTITAATLSGTTTNTGATISGGTVNATTLQQGSVQAILASGTQTIADGLTVTTPVIAQIKTSSGSATLTLPTSTDTLVGRATTDTLTNKTLTSPVISTIVNTGTLTLPTSTDTLVGRATTDTLTNKTLTSPVIATIVNTGTLTLPTSTDTLVGRATTDSLTNKTLTGSSNSIGSGATLTNSGTISGGTISATTISASSSLQKNGVDVVTVSDTQTLTSKTLTTPIISTFYKSSGGNLITVPVPASADTVVLVDQTQTLTGKTLSSPAFSGQVSTDIELGAGKSIIFEGTTADTYETTLTAGDPTADRVITLPNATTNLIGNDTTDELSNKTLGASNSIKSGATLTATGATISGGTINATTLQQGGVQAVTTTGSQTLTNKTISGSSNTLSNIPQSAVTSLETDLAGKQPLDADLTAIAGLSGTTGFLKKTAADTWSLDTSTYLSGNQTISISGADIVSASGTTSLSVVLNTTGVTAGTYNNSATAVRPFTVDAKGRVTGIGTAVTITPDWNDITNKPSNLSGSQVADNFLTALSIGNLVSGETGIIVRTGDTNTSAEARTIVVSGTGLSITNGNGVADNPTITLNSSASATANTIALRDSGGGLTVGELTAAAISGTTGTFTSTISGVGSATVDKLAGASGFITLNGGTSGSSKIVAPLVAGSTVLTLPASTDTLVGRATTDVLTNKTLTTPVIAAIKTNSGAATLTLPTSTDTLVGRDTSDTLTNKILTSPTISTIINTGTLTLPTSTDVLVGRATTDTLTSKTLTNPILTSTSTVGSVGSLGYENGVYYGVPATSSRAAISAFYYKSTEYKQFNNNATSSVVRNFIFSTGTVPDTRTGGSFSVVANHTYEIDLFIDVNALSITLSGTSVQLYARIGLDNSSGSAYTFTGILSYGDGANPYVWPISLNELSASDYGSFNIATTSNAGTYVFDGTYYIKGILTCTASGLVAPYLAVSGSTQTASRVTLDSAYIKIAEIPTTTVGAWS